MALLKAVAGRAVPLSLIPRGSQVAWFSVSARSQQERKYDLVIVGGGTAGLAMTNKFSYEFGKGKVALVEPNEKHFYHSMFPQVGAGIKRFSETSRPTSKFLPDECEWLKDKVTKFDPDNNTVTTASGDKLKYDYLIVSMGLQSNFNSVKGLEEALLADPDVCSTYHPSYVEKTFSALEKIQSGNAIFTYPKSEVKNPASAQSMCYLAEDYFTRLGKRGQINVMYNTSESAVFGIPWYAELLEKISEKRNIAVNTRRNLIEVDYRKKVATFELLDSPGKTESCEYSLLHATPPMSTPKELHGSGLVDQNNLVSVNMFTMQHTKYTNVFGMGDCTNVPTAKTDGAIATQVGVVNKNLRNVMQRDAPAKTLQTYVEYKNLGKDSGCIVDTEEPSEIYNGYTACPVLTSNRTCMLAEVAYDNDLRETFRRDQRTESEFAFKVAVNYVPFVYWNMLLKGIWHGPETLSLILHAGVPRVDKVLMQGYYDIKEEERRIQYLEWDKIREQLEKEEKEKKASLQG